MSKSEIITGILVFAAGLLLFATPLIAPLFVFVGAGFAFFHSRRQGHSPIGNIRDDYLRLALIGFCGFCLASAIWALDPGAAAKKTFVISAVLMLGSIVIRSLNFISPKTIEIFSKAILLAVSVASVVAVADSAFGMALIEMFFNAFPSLAPANFKGLTVEQGAIVDVQSNVVNRGRAVFGFMFWPFLLMASAYPSVRIRRVLLFIAAPAVLIAVFASDSNSIQVALGFGAVAFILFRLWPMIAPRIFMAGWCAAVLLVAPASYLAYEAGLHEAEWLSKRTARARLYIWRFTAEQIPENPLFGIGVRSTRVFAKTHEQLQDRSDGDRYVKRPGWHAHNFYLQTWFELGAVGAAFVLGIGLLLLDRVKRLKYRIRPYGYATFVTLSGAIAFGWGMWQTWLWAGAILTIVVLLIGNLFADWRDGVCER
jgi:O-antigen ligase